MMWVAWSAVLIPLALVLCGLSAWAIGSELIDWIVFPLILLFQVAVAASVGIAVLRYRLWAIERIVNRTLVYASVTGLLLVVYGAITVGLGVLVGGDSAWVVALATLVVASRSGPSEPASRTSSTGASGARGIKACGSSDPSRTTSGTAAARRRRSVSSSPRRSATRWPSCVLAPGDRGVRRCGWGSRGAARTTPARA